MSIYETEAAATPKGETQFRETRQSQQNVRNAASMETLDYAAFGVAAFMTLAPLFAYAVGFGA